MMKRRIKIQRATQYNSTVVLDVVMQKNVSTLNFIGFNLSPNFASTYNCVCVLCIGNCNAEWVWNSCQRPRQTRKAIPAADLRNHSVAFE